PLYAYVLREELDRAIDAAKKKVAQTTPPPTQITLNFPLHFGDWNSEIQNVIVKDYLVHTLDPDGVLDRQVLSLPASRMVAVANIADESRIVWKYSTGVLPDPGAAHLTGTLAELVNFVEAPDLQMRYDVHTVQEAALSVDVRVESALKKNL